MVNETISAKTMVNETISANFTGLQASFESDTTSDAVTLFAIAMACLGIFTNVLAFVALHKAYLPNRALRLGLLSLSVADCLIAFSTACLLAFSYHWSRAAHWLYVEDDPLYRREWCAYDVFKRLWSISTDANQFTLLFLAGQQFVTVRWPLKVPDGIAPSKCLAVLGAMWTASVVMGFTEPVVIAAASEDYPQVEQWPEKGTTRFCYQLVLYSKVNDSTGDYEHKLGQYEHLLAFTTYGISLFIVDLIVLAVSYGYTTAAVERVVKSEERLCQTSVATRSSWKPDRRRVLWTTLAVTLVCLFCYTPLFIFGALSGIGCLSCANPIYFPVLMSLICLAPIADPIIYTLRLKAVRRWVTQTVACCRYPVVGLHLVSKTQSSLVSKTSSNEDSPTRPLKFIL